MIDININPGNYSEVNKPPHPQKDPQKESAPFSVLVSVPDKK